MTYPYELNNPAQANWPPVVNENLEAMAHQAVYAKRYQAVTGLTWAYHGGRWSGFAVADGTFTLTNAADNYIVAKRSDGVTSASTATTNWNNTTDYARVYKVPCAGGAITEASIEDHRAGLYGVHGIAVAPSAVGDVVGPGSATDNDLARFDGVTGKLLKAGFSYDNDATLAAASATKVATQQATKAYVDAKVAGLSWKQAVRAATTAAVTLASDLENGDTIDGVVLATGDRILVKNQASATENGIYVVAASGAPTRATDADSGAELVNASVYVSEGTTLADTQWTCSTNATITIGATNIAFAQLTSAGNAVATDAIWDAAGDLAVGSGANTAAKLSRGTALQVLRVNAGETALEWATPSGGSTQGRHAVYIAAGSITPSVSGGCAVLSRIASAADQPDIVSLNFDPTTQEYAQFSLVMPKSWDEGTVTFAPVWSHAATTTNFGVVWDLQGYAASNDDAIATAFGTAQNSADTGGTTNDIYMGPESSAITIAGTPASEDTVFFRLSRVTGNGSDTMAIDARLHGIVLYITTNADTDA
jgi:hypothetical protein